MKFTLKVVYFTLVALPFTACGDAKLDKADPIYKYCESTSVGRMLDCSCAVENAPRVREIQADKQFEIQQNKIPRLQSRIKHYKSELEKNLSAARKAGLQRRIDVYQKEIAELNIRPDPASLKPRDVLRYYDKAPECKSKEKVYESTYRGCLTTSKDKSEPNSFCNCVADKVSDRWINPDLGFALNLGFALQSEMAGARLDCR